MLRTSQVDVNALAQFVADQGIQPDWDQWSMIQIPQGQSHGTLPRMHKANIAQVAFCDSAWR